MKRHERISREARQHALAALTLLIASVAMGVWSVGVNSSSVPGGMMLLLLALIGFLAALQQGRESARLFRMADEETHWDHIRSIRPRL